jgi:hypothetical protein
MNNKKSQTTTSKPKSRTMSGAVIASPRIIIRVSIETAHHDRGAGSLEAYRGHGLLAKVSFDTTNRLPFPTLSLSCSIDNRDVVFVLLSAFSRGLLELARQNLLHLRIRAPGEKDLLLQPHRPTSDRRLGAEADKRLAPSTYSSLRVETQVKSDDNRPAHFHQPYCIPYYGAYLTCTRVR